MNKYLFLTIAVTLFLILSSCSKKEVRIKIIETSDVHGAIFPFDIVNQKERHGSLSQVFTYVENERANTNQSVILVDNGDILQGDPAIYYSNYIDTKNQHILSQVMNFMKYDLGTVGNHDIEPGHDVYDKFNDEINFPWLAANAVSIDSGKPYFGSYRIIEREGVEIAFLGLITPAIPNWLYPNLYEGMMFEDMIESAEYWIEVIKNEEDPDVIIGLFHAGVNYLYGNQTDTTYKNENASRLVAEKVPGFDAVLVGHDHQGWNEFITNVAGEKVLLAGPTSKAFDVISIDIILSENKSGFDIDSIICETVDMSNYKPNEDFVSTFSMKQEEINDYFSDTIGTFSDEMFSTDAIFGNSAFVDFIHEIQMEYTGADISFSASMSFSDIIPKGEFRTSDLFKLYKYDNLLYTIELTGQEIKDYLEYSYGKWFNTMKSEDDNLLNFKRDKSGHLILSERTGKPILSGQFYNFDSAFGIEYTVDITKEPGSRISISGFDNGDGFLLDNKYRICLNSYRGNGGGGHLIYGAGIMFEEIPERIISVSEYDMRYYIMEWIKEKNIISPTASGNWKVIPEEFYLSGRSRDFNLLYN